MPNPSLSFTFLLVLCQISLIGTAENSGNNRFEYRTVSHEEAFYPESYDTGPASSAAFGDVDVAVGRRKGRDWGEDDDDRPKLAAVRKRDKGKKEGTEFCISGFCIDEDYKKLEMPAGELMIKRLKTRKGIELGSLNVFYGWR
jgi:hypothetical protein